MEMSKASQDLIATLCDRFPAAFSLKRPLPLKVGVGNEIAKMLGVNPRAVGLALGFYCNRSAYLSVCKEGATRVDLDGNPAGSITEAEATHTKRRIGEIRAVWRAKREARLVQVREVEAKHRERLTPGAEYKPQQRQKALADPNSPSKRRQQATVTRTKPTVVVTVRRSRLSLHP